MGKDCAGGKVVGWETSTDGKNFTASSETGASFTTSLTPGMHYRPVIQIGSGRIPGRAVTVHPVVADPKATPIAIDRQGVTGSAETKPPQAQFAALPEPKAGLVVNANSAAEEPKTVSSSASSDAKSENKLPQRQEILVDGKPIKPPRSAENHKSCGDRAKLDSLTASAPGGLVKVGLSINLGVAAGCTGTVAADFEISLDGNNFMPLGNYPQITGLRQLVTTDIAQVLFFVPAGGGYRFRAKVSSDTGVVTVGPINVKTN